MRSADALEALESGSAFALVHGDALLRLAELPDELVDAVITDCPYSSGGQFRGDRALDTTSKYVQSGAVGRVADFSGDNRDQRSFGYWCALWLSECRRVAKPGALLCCFSDWRQLPMLTDAVQAGGWVWRGLVSWDKTEAVRPQMGRFRSQCEYIVWASSGPLPPRDDVGVLPGVIRCAVDVADKHHIAGKPVAVMAALARICTPGGLVLDPFMGSGSTGVGALREGRRFLGIEIERRWCDLSLERLAAEITGSTLDARLSGQQALFGS